MDDVASVGDLCDPVQSYVRPIRSVLFVDDQFPTFDTDADSNFAETLRARALWRACTERGWLCDIDNATDWTSPQRRQRLAACDLLVLDLHLVGQDSRPALAIIQDLADSSTPNLVVVYTADEKLDDVLMSVAVSARGASNSAFGVELDSELESISIEWSRQDILDFIGGGRRWMTTFAEACRAVHITPSPKNGEVLLERWIANEFDAPRRARPLALEKISCSTRRWFQSGNLFLTVIGKPAEQCPEDEASVVLDGLEAAIRDWDPPWLACLVASSRRNVETGAFRDDALLPEADLQDGLLRYVRETDDEEESARRAREIGAHLLARRFSEAAELMSTTLLARAMLKVEGVPETDRVQKQFLHLNAFLCSEVFSRHHLRVGSVFRDDDRHAYWVCVTPACDMVPRERKRSIDPWANELDPLRPMLALRLKICRGDEITQALSRAERGRYLFFNERKGTKFEVVVTSCFNISTDDPNPQIEQMFALDRARVRDGQVLVRRCVRDEDQTSGGIALEQVACTVVCQLRAPYAERLAHIVGNHLSRIGVNFLNLPSLSADE